MIQIYRNAPTQAVITVILPPGQTLAGKQLTFTAKTSVIEPNTTNVFQKSSPSDGITITGDFTATMEIDPADTVALDNFGQQSLVYNIILTDGSLDYPIAVDTLVVNGNPAEAIL